MCMVCLQAMVGILQGKARGGEEESALMHDLKPFRILISLLDKPELGTTVITHRHMFCFFNLTGV